MCVLAVFFPFCIVPIACLYASVRFWNLVFNYLTSCVSCSCVQAAGALFFKYLTSFLPFSRAKAAGAASPVEAITPTFVLTLEEISADTAALHAAEKPRWLATVPPAAPQETDMDFELSAAQVQENTQDRCAALATRAAAYAGRPGVSPAERKKLLAAAAAARRNKDAAPQVPCLAEAQRFAVEQAAQQQADVLDTTCCSMSEKEQWAAWEAANK
jgi:hypothetical protein